VYDLKNIAYGMIPPQVLNTRIQEHQCLEDSLTPNPVTSTVAGFSPSLGGGCLAAYEPGMVYDKTR
jgi:hypothetical protein